MALCGSARDISMSRHINKELINDIIQTEVDLYELNLTETKSNIYGESSSTKSYFAPVRLAALITRDPNIDISNEMGMDSEQSVTFGFLRDGTLDELNLVPEIGDVIAWDERYWEINSIEINQYVMGRNDLTNKTIGDGFGANWSYMCKTHLTRRDKIALEPVRFGGK